MKIALCISGGLRNFKDTYYSFQHFLLSQHDVDVFFYGLENKEGEEKNKNDLISLYSPKKFVINTNNFYQSIPCKYQLSSVFYSFYNIYMCNNLKSEYENEKNFKYDLVIRSRSDYFWFRSFNNEEINLSKKNILIPWNWSFKGVREYARSDVFAIGNSDLMNKYSEIYENIDEYTKAVGMFHPESICGYHLKINNIPNIENERCVVFEYPSKRTEKYIHPYKHIKYFDEPDIYNEDDFLKTVSDKRRFF
jgi:hypothetical protein